MPDDGSWSLTAEEADRVRQRPEAFGTRGMVASAHPVAAFIGLTILQRGGRRGRRRRRGAADEVRLGR